MARKQRRNTLLFLTISSFMAQPAGRLCLGEDSAGVYEKPRIVYVAESRADLRSGPEQEFYPTTRVDRGTVLEVHLRTQEGWLGIRPPEGSFSWVPAKDAYLLPGGRVIEITSPNAVSWIGTDLGSAKQYRWQVQLKVGEQLSVLGESTVAGKDQLDALWYRISPPSGEYRWIDEKAVSSTPVAKGPPSAEVTTPKNLEHSQDAPDDALAPLKIAASNSAKPLPSEPNRDRAVQTAGYQGDVFDDDVFSDQEFTQSEYMDGEILDSSPNGMSTPVRRRSASGGNSGSSDPWDGWHAMEFADDGLRLTWMERWLGAHPAPQHDPLNHDPYDLSMSSSGKKQRPQSIAIQPSGPVNATHGNRPWRDPRTLHTDRGRALDTASSRRQTPQDFVASIRDNVEQIGQSLRAESSRQPLGTSFDSSRNGPHALSPNSGNPTDLRDPEAINWYGVQSGGRGTSDEPRASTSSIQDPLGYNMTVNQELERLRVTLSEMATQPASMWNFQPIVARAKHFIENGQNPYERGQARLLLERIEEFEAHAQRTAYASGGFTPASYSQPHAPMGTASVVTAGLEMPSTFDETSLGRQPYDATGWLVPVHSTSDGQPSHALTDDSGNILAYVSSIPGLNLDRYINQPVGITGLRGYLPQLQSGHLQAQRIVRLR